MLLACALFEIRSLIGGRLYAFAAIEHSTRRIRILGAIAHPTADWIVQLGRNLLMDLEHASKSQASRASAWERREVSPRAGAAFGHRVDPGLLQDLQYRGGGHLDPQHEQFAVHAPVAPRGSLPRQVQHQCADGVYGPQPNPRASADTARVATCDEVAMPSDHCVRMHERARPVQDLPRKPVERCRQEGPITRPKPRLSQPSCRSSMVI